VTASGSGAPGRESETDEAPRRGIGRQILLILGIGLLFRLILAYALPGLRGSGFGADLTLFNYWADVLAGHQPWGFYANASYADYTPGYLYVLWPVGIAREIGTGLGLPHGLLDNLIKLPAILTDVAMSYLVWSMATELGASRRKALIAATVVVLNPLTWFDSVIWGQVDSFGTVFLMLGMRELWRGRHERASVLAVVAALIKPQLAILVPIVAVITIRRALWPKGGFGEEEPASVSAAASVAGGSAPRPTTGIRSLWSTLTRGPLRIVTVGVIGYLTAIALSAPFGLTVIGFGPNGLESSLLKLVFSTAATYPYLTVNAYNWWALFPVDGNSVVTAGGALWTPDSPIKDAATYGSIFGVPAAVIGAAALLAVFAAVAWVVARKPDRLTILVGVSVLALAFFAVPTRVHERYLFPFFGLAGILFAISNRWKVAYVVASIATFLNMYVVLVALYPDNPHVSDWIGLGALIRSPFGIVAVVLMHSAAFLFGFLQLRGSARRRLAVELEAAAIDEEPAPASGPMARAGARGGAAGSASGAGASAGAIAGSAAAAGAARLVPAWYDRPSWSEMGPWQWLKARVGETPVRPDRSAGLAREKGGRVDRLDMLVVLVIVVASLVLRGYRLGDPPRMHFDEVYHARTAAEFLQDWRYGIDHEIYEWTHPHFAKYAMAVGIMAFAGHDVQSSSDLGVPVRDALVEPRREDTDGGTTPAGNRMWVATGSELIAYDLTTRALVGRWAVPGAATLAFDETDHQVLVGTDGGDLMALDATSLDGVTGGDPNNPDILPNLVETLSAGVTRMAPYSDGAHVAALLADGTIAVVDTDTGETAGTASVAGAADLVQTEDVSALRALPATVTDAEAAAAKLVQILGGDEAAYLAALTSIDAESVPLGVAPTTDEHQELQKAMDAGELAGVEFQPVNAVAVAGSEGLTILDTTGSTAAMVEIAGGARGLAQVTGVDDGAQLYATGTSDVGEPQVTIVDVSGDRAKNGPKIANDAGETPTFRLPGAGTRVMYDEASEMVEVLGTTPDGAGTTVYVVEPHGKSVFADHRLPFAPVALALDHSKDFPSTSHGDLYAFSAQGTAASMDVGSYHFSWRLPGVIFGRSRRRSCSCSPGSCSGGARWGCWSGRSRSWTACSSSRAGSR
jgi:hypothetical protein